MEEIGFGFDSDSGDFPSDGGRLVEKEQLLKECCVLNGRDNFGSTSHIAVFIRNKAEQIHDAI